MWEASLDVVHGLKVEIGSLGWLECAFIYNLLFFSFLKYSSRLLCSNNATSRAISKAARTIIKRLSNVPFNGLEFRQHFFCCLD